jgi:UDP-galactopyranose mutase
VKPDFCVVGAGFAGATVAERLADAGARVLVIDKRPHVAGNAYDELDEHGVLVHRYGPHIFHTNAARIVDYLSNFTTWRPYEHRVRAVVDGRQYPLPINRDTINQLYGLDLDESGVAEYLSSVR